MNSVCALPLPAIGLAGVGSPGGGRCSLTGSQPPPPAAPAPPATWNRIPADHRGLVGGHTDLYMPTVVPPPLKAIRVAGSVQMGNEKIFLFLAG